MFSRHFTIPQQRSTTKGTRNIFPNAAVQLEKVPILNLIAKRFDNLRTNKPAAFAKRFFKYV